MSNHDPYAAATLYLQALSAGAPPGALLDVRYRRADGRFAQAFLDARDPDVPTRIVRIGQQADVYVGCAMRVRRRGTRQDLAPTALLWADCDDRRALAAVRAHRSHPRSRRQDRLSLPPGRPPKPARLPDPRAGLGLLWMPDI
jgi:hypothetical protein